MKKLYKIIIAMSGVLTINLCFANAQSWTKWIDCLDGYGNQLVIDIDASHPSLFQMVLRPAPIGNPSVIDYLISNKMVYNQPHYGEIIVPMQASNEAQAFFHSDRYMTHTVTLDENAGSTCGPCSDSPIESSSQGAMLETFRNESSVHWYFNRCTKYY